jgi:hypothetical protein
MHAQLVKQMKCDDLLTQRKKIGLDVTLARLGFIGIVQEMAEI